MRAATLCTALALLVLSPAAPAHDHATGVIKERMDMMEEMAKNMKAITTRVRARNDLGGIAKPALALSQHAQHITMLFPPGSRQPPTEATERIWQRPDDFAAKAKALEVAAQALARADLSDTPRLIAQARAVSQACSECHELYRRRTR